MNITDIAMAFFDACETGKGSKGVAGYCHANASFSAQANKLDGIKTIEAYADWAAGLFEIYPDASYELRGFAHDEARSIVLGFANFTGTELVEGASEPTRFSVEYVYAMEFDGDKISHMTKIWNDSYS